MDTGVVRTSCYTGPPVTSFLDRNLVARAPSGAEIPNGARTTILMAVNQRTGMSPTHVWETFIRKEALGTWQEIDEDIRARMGNEAADAFGLAMKQHRERDRNRMHGMPGVNYDAEPALQALPAPFFLTAMEYAFHAYGGVVQPDLLNEVNNALNKVGASYRFDWSGNADWHGDKGIHDAVVKPALAALADPRLAGCASEYHAALNHMRAGTAKDLEDAIEESAKAVESAMKVLLDARKVKRTGKEAAHALFQLLVDKGICPPEADNAVLGAARFRNNLGGHGTGAQPRVLPDGVPDMAVNSAATAIKYLADLLP
jgi:hypothetical protein